TDLLRARVAAGRPALEPDRAEPFRRDREAVELVPMVRERGRQVLRLEVIVVERIVRGEYAVLQREIEARRGLPRAGDPEQDQLRLRVEPLAAAVVRRER